MKKHLVVAMAILACCIASSRVSADSCKPDLSSQDKISKQQVDRWVQALSSSGLLSAALMGNDVTFIAMVGRYGDVNAIGIEIQKEEDNLARAAFETQYHAAKGDQFVFGLKNGEPLSFVATEVANQSKAGSISGKLVMTVLLSAIVPNKDLAALRDALTTKQIDAVRIALASGQVEVPVKDKNGKKLMEKFGCFYQFLDKKGIDLSAAAGPQNQPPQPGSPSAGEGNVPSQGYAASAPGKYTRKDKSTDYVELKPDGTFSLLQDGHSVGGTYKVHGDTLTLTSPQLRAPSKAALIGGTMKDDEGIVWEKEAGPVKPLAQLTVDQIIQMVAAKLPDDIIITTIRNSGSKFDLTPEVLIKMKTAGVSDAVIRAMTP